MAPSLRCLLLAHVFTCIGWKIRRWTLICATSILLLQELPVAICHNHGDVRLANGPSAYEGRPEMYYKGVWLSLCYTNAQSIAPVICKQLGYSSSGAVSYYSRSYGAAPGEILRNTIYCSGTEHYVTSCQMTNTTSSCDPRYTLGVSCNASTSAKSIRLRDGSTPYEGRLEVFVSGVWGTVCRSEEQYYPSYVQSSINANVACKEIFGPSYGGKYYPAHETLSRFGTLNSSAIAMSSVKCNGNETSLMSCSHSFGGTDMSCLHDFDASLRCFPVPNSCGGFYVLESGNVTSPGYPTGHTYVNDTECVWKLMTTKKKQIQLSFPTVLSHNSTGTINSIQVVSSNGFSVQSISYGTALSNFTESNADVVYIVLNSAAGKLGLDFHAVWQPVVINCNTTRIVSSSRSSSTMTFNSVGYYSYYPPEIDCYYLVQFRKDYKAQLSFQLFDLDDALNGTCQDYLQVFDGNTTSAVDLGKYCGDVTPRYLNTTQNSVLIHFHSDDNFKDTSRGYSFKVNGIETIDPVVTFLNTSSGVITSPGYPSNYSHETDYEWVISVPLYMSVTLTFHDFLTSCDYGTKLLIQDAYPSGSQLASVCGGGLTQPVLSNTNVMYLRLDSAPGVSTGNFFNLSWESECRRIYTSSSGVISSPDYPNAYPVNMDCVYIITRDSGYIITLTLTSFSLDSRVGNDCRDYLSVYDGSFQSDRPLVNKFCGTSLILPFTVKSEQRSMLIKFHSDNNTNSASLGFQATFTSEIKVCEPHNFIDPRGNFTSPRYPVEYPHFTFCTWNITVSKGRVELKFTHLAVGERSGQDCNTAYVRVYDSNDLDASHVIATLCGVASSEQAIVSTGRSLIVVLSSFGNSYNSQNVGFAAKYETIHSDDIKQSALFEYGDTVGDLVLGSSDSQVKVEEGFPFGHRMEYDIFVERNGLVSIGKGYTWPDLSENHSVICVYCAYINSTEKSGGIYYQLYETDTRGVLTKANAELRNQIALHGNKENFKAEMVLVVTWDRVQQGRYRLVDYNPSTSDGIATFQLALISNRISSYALMYYKYGNMTWKPRGIWSYVVMGVSDGSLENYEKNFYSMTATAYKIDVILGNSGKMGTWIFKLGEVPKNPRTVCQQWLQVNDDPSAIDFSHLPSCPCSLRDVWRRTRYMWTVEREEDGGKVVCYRMNMANSDVNYPLGKECCYGHDSNHSRTLDMWLKWPNSNRAGASLAKNPVYWHLREQYEQEDRIPHDACCNPSLQDWELLCSQFYDRRPQGECLAEIPFRFTWLMGDPHIITLDEREYSFNGYGEYILIRANNFVLQGRTSLAVNDNGAEVNATVFTAFAAQENGTQVFVQLDPNTNNSLIIYGGETDYTLRFQREGEDFLVDLAQYTMLRDGTSLVVTFPSGMTLSVSVGVSSLLLRLVTPQAFRNKTQGLMGNFNGLKGDDFRLPNGTVLPDSLTDRQLFLLFSNAWAVTVQNSIFRYGRREGQANYSHPDFLPVFLDEVSAPDRQAAEAVCGAQDRACIYDYVATGSQAVTLATKTARETALKDNADVKNTLPTLTVPQNVTVMSNVATKFSVNGTDPDSGDVLTYKLANDWNGNLNIDSRTGEITATINETQSDDIEVYAVDSHGGQSVVQSIPIIVCSPCNGHGHCNVTSAVRSANSSVVVATCVCNTGWTGVDCSQDLNACLSSPCHPLQTCADRTPQQEVTSGIDYSCSPCPAGYGSPGGSPNLCLDIDECSSPDLNRCQGNCSNIAGSYTCSCLPGYRLSSDQTTCVDINECAEKLDNCQQLCKNTEGHFECSCTGDFTLDEGSLSACVPSRETTRVCVGSRCSQGCRAVPGPTTGNSLAQCYCYSGYDLDPDTNITCRDHNECLDAISPCDQKCNNTEGRFTCSCYGGFRLNADQRTCSFCPDQTYGPDCSRTCACDPRGALRCHPSTGCLCRPGWTGNDCGQDVDECEEKPDVCGEGGGALCLNTNGSYACVCRDGYQLDSSGLCRDVNECIRNPCLSHERCTNIPGGFYCSCLSGYHEVSGNCTDIDECQEGTHNCQQRCVNVPETFSCDCYYGYRLSADRVTCTQISNPCVEVKSLSCAHGCTLDDVTSTAVCFCRSGYSLNSDGQTCSDINECAATPSQCSHNCSNTEGGFVCFCPAGMRLDNSGTKCQACPNGTYGVSCSGICACGLGASGCDVVTGCQCMLGWSGDKCDGDVNECVVSSTTQTCLAKGARCVNTPGSYRCQCAVGYRFNSAGQCEDINECESSPCNQVCENSPGSFRCLCKPGFALDAKTGDCTEVDECALAVTNDCAQRCENTIGSYRCSCSQPGYSLNNDGRTCSASTVCSSLTCDNVNGGCLITSTGEQRCFCNLGFALAANGNSCIAEYVDFCAKGACGDLCQISADNTSFTCSCRDGYLLNEDRRTCRACSEGTFGRGCQSNCTCSAAHTTSCDHVNGSCTCAAGWGGADCTSDVNECTLHLCGDHANCTNTIGSYSCSCVTGYIKNVTGYCGACPANTYGDTCHETCSCHGANVVACDHVTGRCLCKAGWGGVSCDVDKDECASPSTHNCSASDNKVCSNTNGSYTCVCQDGYKKVSDVCRAVGRLNFTVKIQVTVPVANLLVDPSKSKIRLEAQNLIFGHLSPFLPLLSVDIFSMKAGSVIVDAAAVVANETMSQSASKLSVALVSLAGSNVTLDGQAGPITFYVGAAPVTSDAALCEVYTQLFTCSLSENCTLENGSPSCKNVQVQTESNTDLTGTSLGLIIGLSVGAVILAVIIAVVVNKGCTKRQSKKYKRNSVASLNGQLVNRSMPLMTYRNPDKPLYHDNGVTDKNDVQLPKRYENMSTF